MRKQLYMYNILLFDIEISVVYYRHNFTLEKENIIFESFFCFFNERIQLLI